MATRRRGGYRPGVTTNYVGPDGRLLRTITDLNANDPVFSPFSTPANTISLPGTRASNGAPLSRVMLTFAFFDAGGLRKSGGTANLRPFFVEQPATYGLTESTTSIVHPIADELADYNLSDPLIVTVTKHRAFGVRVTNIVAPMGATELRIAVQEFT